MTSALPPSRCRLCSQLKEHETAHIIHARPEASHSIPGAALHFKVVKDFEPYFSNRQRQLQQCPECETHYYFEGDYHIHGPDTETRQQLRRLSAAETREYLARPTPHASCGICSQLLNTHLARQKNGRPEEATHLPAAADKLEVVKDVEPSAPDRQQQLKQCPECRTYYLYETGYEFDVTGSEDEQYLKRISPAEAGEYLS